MGAHSWDFGDGSKEMWELAVITNELVSDLTFWAFLPYVAACATVFAVTGCFKMVSIQLRREYPLLNAAR